MYSLQREGKSVERGQLDGRAGDIDRPHIFQDGTGPILPATRLESSDAHGAPYYRGRTLKQGPPHSHEGAEHELHMLEKMDNPKQDLLNRFKRNSRNFREERWQSRDR